MRRPASNLGSQYPARRLSIAAVLTAIMLAWLGWNAFHSYQAIKSIQARVFRIEELRGTIIHLDEVLTMSARMAAAANDLRWEREGVRHLSVHHRGVSAGGVTVSMGVAFFPEHGRTSEALLRAAEETLHKAKAEGRDRVLVAQAVSPSALAAVHPS